MKIGYRQGDAADMVILELVDYDSEKAGKKDTKVAKKASDKPAEKKAAAKKTTEKKAKAPAKEAKATSSEAAE
jgi:large subunit ribosomal protein L17